MLFASRAARRDLGRVAFVTTGSNRLVLLVGCYAVKIPNVRSWWTTLWGLIDNCQERRANGLGRWGRRQEGIAPLVFSLPGGFLNVMRRAEPVPDHLWQTFDPAAHCQRDGYWIQAEPKRDSFGLLEGQIVAVDYGN